MLIPQHKPSLASYKKDLYKNSRACMHGPFKLYRAFRQITTILNIGTSQRALKRDSDYWNTSLALFTFMFFANNAAQYSI
jgi:hypothetical protein